MAKIISFLWRISISYGDNPNSYGEYRTPYGDNLASYGENPLTVWRKLFCYGGYGVRGRRR
jgi:hypothetical protein